MDKPKRVSSKDVAREAGVSQATVSYVLNNVKGVSIKPETREAVLLAARKLNYHPNLIARSMRLKKSMSIGVVSDKNVSNLLFMTILQGVKDALMPRNYSITLCLSKSYDIENSEHIKYYSSNRIDGILFVYADIPDEHLAYLVDNGIPFVMIHSDMKDDMANVVKTDMTNAMDNALRYLRGKGVERVTYLNSGSGDKWDRRYHEYTRAIERMDSPFAESNILTVPRGEEKVEETVYNFLSSMGSMPGAMFCDTTGLAFRVLREAARLGIKIPSELSVIAIGTSRFSSLAYPSLSAIEAPLYEMGRTGAEMLLDIMNNSVSNSVVVLEWEFNRRESC